MWEVFLYRNTYKWLFYAFVGILVLIIVWYFNNLRKENPILKQKISVLTTQYEACQRANAELTKQIETQYSEYQKKVEKLLKEASKPPKVIEIPTIIEKPIYIPTEDCQKMGVMIDNFIKLQKEN